MEACCCCCCVDGVAVCCCCLSSDRKLVPLKQVKNGLNTLHHLLTYDIKVCKERMKKRTDNLIICWECKALLIRTCKFRDQVIAAQSAMLHLPGAKKITLKSLSNLSEVHQDVNDQEIVSADDIDIKEENTSDLEADHKMDVSPEPANPLFMVAPNTVNDSLKPDNRILKPVPSTLGNVIFCPAYQPSVLALQNIVKNISNASKVPIILPSSTNQSVRLSTIRQSPRNPRYLKIRKIFAAPATQSSNGQSVMLNTMDQSLTDTNNCTLDKIKILKVTGASDGPTPRIFTEKDFKEDVYFDVNSINMTLEEISNDNFKTEDYNDNGKDSDSESVKTDVAFDDLSIAETREFLRQYIKNLEKKPSDDEKPILDPDGNIVIDKSKFKEKVLEFDISKPFFTIQMTKRELLESVQKRKAELLYFNATTKCESCVEDFECQEELNNHNIKFHNSQCEKNVQCKICLAYIRKRKINHHVNEHYKLFMCRTCPFETHSNLNMIEHIYKEHSIQNYVVPITPLLEKNNRRKTKKELKFTERHSIGYVCMECKDYFELRQLPPRQMSCPKCDKTVRFDLMSPTSVFYRKCSKFSCFICDIKFRNELTYYGHFRISKAHTKYTAGRYDCDFCEKNFKQRQKAYNHIDYVHLGKVLSCEICKKACPSQDALLKHIKITHTKINKRTFVCSICGKGFFIKKCLIEHEYIHTGERPFKCDLCGQSFRQKACLYTHNRLVHEKFKKTWPKKKKTKKKKCSDDFE